MDVPNIPGLEELLKELPLDDIAPPPKVRVMLAHEGSTFYLHCFVPGTVTMKELKGELFRGQTTYYTNMPDFYKAMREALEESGIVHHDDAAGIVGENHAKVTFTMQPAHDDTNADNLIDALEGTYGRVNELLGN